MSADGAAIIALILYAAVAAAIFGVGAYRSCEDWQSWVLMMIARPYASFMYQMRIRQLCPYPKGGALVLVNHRSPLDPLFIFSSSKCGIDGDHVRVVEFLTATEYVELGGVIGWICKYMRSIPVDRDGQDMNSAKIALRRLQHGQCVGIFPEGRINFGSGLLPAIPGVAWLALKSNKPVIPVFIHGAPQSTSMVAPFITPGRVRVDYGQPIDMSRFAGERMTPELLNRVSTLLMDKLADTGGIPRPSETIRLPRPQAVAESA
jgi:1-acyl-sn-glycerol-3-phosphate acyltransferase